MLSVLFSCAWGDFSCVHPALGDDVMILVAIACRAESLGQVLIVERGFNEQVVTGEFFVAER